MDGNDTKLCPRCGALLFQDMDVCYECLHELSGDGGDVEGGEEVWETEEVPLEVYPEQLDASLETQTEMPSSWALHMSTDSVDVDVAVPPHGLVMGRSPACDVVLHARSVSRQHVHVEPDADGLFVRDLGARNAPRINGRPVSGEAHMSPGDELLLCGTTFVLESR